MAVAGLLALPLQAEAQTTLVSNTGQTSEGHIGDSRDLAQAFTTRTELARLHALQASKSSPGIPRATMPLSPCARST